MNEYKNNHNIIPTYFFQINFFKDHTKVILCPLMGAVTYIDEKRRSRTFRFDLIKEHGCSEDIATRLQYVLEKVESMLTSHKSTTSSSEYNVPTLSACRLVIFILATKGYSWICKKWYAGSGKSKIQKFILWLYLDEREFLKISAKLVKKALKTGFFLISRKSGSKI